MLFVNPPDKEIAYIKEKISELCASEYGKRAIYALTFFQDINSLNIEINKINKLRKFLNIYRHLEPVSINYINEILQKIEKIDFLTEEETGKIFVNLKVVEGYVKSFLELEIIGEFLDDKVNYDSVFEVTTLLSYYLTFSGFIKNDATQELKQILDNKEQIRDKIHKIVDKVLLNKRKYLQDSFFVIRDGRYVLPVKANFKKDFRGIVRDTSHSGDTLFMEPFEISELNDQLLIINKMEEREKVKILKTITLELKKYYKDLIKILDVYGYWDSLVARVKGMEKYGLLFPEIDQKDIFIKSAIHPLLMDKNPVPNDFIIKENVNVLLITGPNGGGKTVALKTLAFVYAATYMAIPVSIANGSKIKFYEKFYFDILDIQDIEQGVSSFTAKMILWRKILDEADDRTLVIIDEMGSFTNPQEGSAISCAFLSYLIEKKATIVAGTHLDQIKEFLINRENSIIASFLWDDRLLKPTYKMVYGTYSMSYAIDVLKSMGFEDQFVKRCCNFLGRDFINLKKMIDNYSHKLSDIAKKSKEIDSIKDELRRVLAEKIEIFKQVKAKLLKMEREYEEKVKDLLNKYQNLLNLENQKANNKKYSFDNLLVEKQKVSDLIKNILPRKKKDFNVGDEVYLKELNKQGKIINIGKSKVSVLVDGKKLSFDKNMIYESIKENHAVKKDNNRFSQVSGIEKEFSIIDLRGYKVDDALAELEKFIDNAYLSGINKVKIIHGAGKGRLKEFIHDYLKRDSRIKKFSTGDLREKGGSYYTDVEF
ncbi:MAG: Smr/MutS family protein [Proteobacteria bacterium]|nr:Smr/MutS family protein [Pseudomonadota bacterium]